ncbi:hypothetical protein [Metabacillus sp. 22489]|uniref:hypothetical protein n=1 Tax=Metabacillus sp. 22489 TaxID=3453928 RepID=UPI003F850787
MKVIKGDNVIDVPGNIPFKFEINGEVIDHKNFKELNMKITISNDVETVYFVQEDYEM